MIKILVIAFTCFKLHENNHLCGNVASDKIVVEASEVKFLVIDDTLDEVDLVWIDMLEFNIASEETIVDVVELVVVAVEVGIVVVVTTAVVDVDVLVVLVVEGGIVVVVAANEIIQSLRNQLNLIIKYN